MWQWLFSGEHKIEKFDRPILLRLFRKVLYSDTDQKFEEAKNEMFESEVYQKYPNFKDHVENDLLPRSNEWSLLHRVKEQLPTNAVNTSNHVESSYRVTKDLKFNRIRAYNLVEMVQIECDDSNHYAKRCIDMANNTLNSRLKNQHSRYLSKKVNIDETKIIKEDDGTFTVPSETKNDVSYSVNIELRTCTCYQGRNKGPCKHKNIVSTTQELPSFDVVPETNPQMRAIWMYLGTGKQVRMSYFMPLSIPGGNPLLENEPNYVEPVETIEPMLVDDIPDDIPEDIPESIPEASEKNKDSHEENQIEETEIQFNNVLEKMKALYFDRIKHDATGYAKAFKTLELHIDRMPKTNDSALQDAVCKFGENSTNAVTATTKKNGKKMNVQSTTVSRRVNVTRGRQAALRGAPRKGHTGPTREIDENGIVRHKLPGAKKKKMQIHLLSKAVNEVRGASKKH